MKLYKYGNPFAATILIQLVDDHDLAVIETEVAEMHRLTNADFHMLPGAEKEAGEQAV